MKEYINDCPRQDIPWSPPAPLHVAMARDAIASHKERLNEKDRPTTSKDGSGIQVRKAGLSQAE